MTQADKIWADGATCKLIDGQWVYADKDGNPIAPRPNSWTPPKPEKPPKTPRKPKQVSPFQAQGLTYVGADYSVPRYVILQNERGGFERWQTFPATVPVTGERVIVVPSGFWYVFIENLD